MTTTTKLEDLYSIAHDNYSTGSEWLDGIIIGLATWLLIRSSEFIVLDLLTCFYGNRKHRTGYRVLRTWQFLNPCHFFKLFTGFDSDLPRKRFRKGISEEQFDRKTVSRLRVKKGRFMPLLVLSVLLGKFLVLAAEVAIIAFVIPVATVHKSFGGLGLRWKNATITERSLAEKSKCEQLLASGQFSETAQIVLCKRVNLRNVAEQVPLKWIPNGSLRFEQIDFTPENMRQAGAVLNNSVWDCKYADADVSVPDLSVSEVRMNVQSAARQVGSGPKPSVRFSNDIRLGEITVSGNSVMTVDGRFELGTAAVLPVFSDAKRTIRLSFLHMFDERTQKGKKIFTLNGKLMIGARTGSVLGHVGESFCPGAIDEIMRVTGTLHPDTIIDILRSSMTVFATRNFSEPSPDRGNLFFTSGFEAGTSRRFRISPEWMALAAGLAMVASAFTSRFNKTEASMARVYREHNNMYSACAPSYLEEESVVEGALFQNGDEYHWGKEPGKGWDQVTSFEHSEEGILV